MTASKDTFVVNYIKPAKVSKTYSAQVQLFLRGNKHMLEVRKCDRRSSVLEEVEVENIGALVINELTIKK